LAGAHQARGEASLSEHSTQEDASQISDEIIHALHHSWFFDTNTITVTEEADGKVRLSGTVASPHDRRRAAVAAWSHPRVTDVVNDIRVV
jgi:osmotically-inducible protein OsmY